MARSPPELPTNGTTLQLLSSAGLSNYAGLQIVFSRLNGNWGWWISPKASVISFLRWNRKDAAYYRGEPVHVIGGANSAGQAAMFFSRYASQVTMEVRSDSLSAGMSKYLVDQISSTPNIRVMSGIEVLSVQGVGKLERITLCNTVTGEEFTIPAAAMFIFIGAAPHTEFIAGLVRCNRAGFILTGPELFDGNERPKD